MSDLTAWIVILAVWGLLILSVWLRERRQRREDAEDQERAGVVHPHVAIVPDPPEVWAVRRTERGWKR